MTVTDLYEPDRATSVEPQFRLVLRTRADGTLVVAHGELDLATAPDLDAVLVAQAGRVIVDLRRLTFIDASGLRALLAADERSRQDGMNLRFIPGELVRRLFEAAGMPDRLTYVEPPVA
jgi:anti-anti-sigma factor